jgi:hypothetical protein
LKVDVIADAIASCHIFKGISKDNGELKNGYSK